MTVKYFFASLTRISNLPEVSFCGEQLPREEWETGDYVVGKVEPAPSDVSQIELCNGRMVEVVEEDLVVGAFGDRYATLEAAGGWRDIGDGLTMEALTGAGLFGKADSEAMRLLSLSYEGHVLLDGEKVGMRDYVPPAPDRAFEMPTVLLLGTSMSAGKTASAKAVVRLLEGEGLRVLGAKLAGAGRYRDVLEMEDAEWFDVVNNNVHGTANTVRAFAPKMAARRQGRLILLSSMQGKHGTKNASSYSASKHAIIGLMKSAALELGEYNITCNCLLPGLVNTALTRYEKRFKNSMAETGRTPPEHPTAQEAWDVRKPTVPMQVGWLQPDDISPVAVFLASDAAEQVTGAEYEVTGGDSAKSA